MDGLNLQSQTSVMHRCIYVPSLNFNRFWEENCQIIASSAVSAPLPSEKSSNLATAACSVNNESWGVFKHATPPAT